MTEMTIPLPYGCRDIKLYPITGGTPATTGIDLPNARTLQFSETENFTDLRGDDALKATHGDGAQVDWTLESGGVSLEAVVAMYGGTITSSGTTPDQVKTYNKKSTDQRPYFQMKGQAISDSGGDFQVKIYKAKSTGDLSGQFSDGNFWLTGAKGVGLADDDDNVYDFIQNETAVDLT